MPSLSSFISTNQYNKESTTIPLLGGMQLGSTYAGVTFNGAGVAITDPGGLFGWLVYSRYTRYSPPKGGTADKYIVYTNPSDLVGDLNKLGSIPKCLISDQNSGGTYGFFENIGVFNNVIRLKPLQNGQDFLYAIHYLAYGGQLILTGGPQGFDQYQNDTNKSLDVIIDTVGTTSNARWLIDQPNTVGIFPTITVGGLTGAGYTMADFATLLGSTTYLSGTTVANRIFNVCGVKRVNLADTTTLLANSKISYDLSAVSDVGGFFTRSKNRNQLYLTVAGVRLSTVLNGSITNTVDWQDSLKDALRLNRVNFFVNNIPKFLGGDVVGATSGGPVTQEERIGVSKLKSAIGNDLNKIGLKYLFEPNNATTRARVTTEMRTAMNKYSSFVFPASTQIICDSSNNTNDSSTLVMTVVFQPVLSIDSFEVTVSVTP
jgi:hypothetical protein